MTSESGEPSNPASIPASPYEGTKISFLDHLRLSSYWFGSNFIWGCFLGPVLSSEMAKLAPESTAGSLGMLYFFGAIPALFVPLIFGPLSDRCQNRHGRRRPYILGGAIVALMGLAAMALGFHGMNVAAYVAGYMVVQVGTNIALAAFSGIIPDLVPVEQRGIASGFMAVMSQVATLFGALFSGLLLGGGNHLMVYAMIAVVFTTFVAIALVGIRENPLCGTLPEFSLRSYLQSLWIDPRKYPDFGWVWITRALMMFGFYAVQPYLLLFLRDIVKVKNPAESAGIAIGIILVGAAISGFVGGRISDAIGRKPVVVASSYLIAVAAVAMLAAQNLPMALAIGVFFGLGYGAYISVDWALGADVLPSKKDAGKDMAIWHVAMTLPQQLAALAGGSILQAFAVGSVVLDGQKVAVYGFPGYATVFVLSAVCFLLGGYLLRNVRSVR